MSARYKRSPFCLLHWDEGTLCALNCNTFRMFRGAQRYVALLDQLTEWTTASELAARQPGGEAKGSERALERLVSMDLVVRDPPRPGEPPSVEEEPGWNLIELAMQRQSAHGGYDPARLRGVAPPAFKQPPTSGSPAVLLPRTPIPEGQSLAASLDARRSVRTYGDGPLPAESLGAFLHTTARVTRTLHDDVVGEFSQRPYPSGGARHPLEIYPVVNDVDGIAGGVYWYDPLEHRLFPLGRPNDGLAELNAEVRLAAGGIPRRDPPVVFVITAVFARTMWKYERIGLGLVLRDLGGLYQTMALAATALSLAGCPLGPGRETETARWLGLDPLLESQVGTFLLGPVGATDPRPQNA